MNRRRTKTKKVLESALIKLMVERGFEKISVKDLTEEADINRGTFYLHYKDKYDLLEQKEEEIIEEFGEIFDDIFKKYSNNIVVPTSKKSLIPFFTGIYMYVKENEEFMRVLLGSNGDLNFQMKLKNFIESRIMENIPIRNNNENIPLKYISAIAVSSQLGVIEKWLKGGMQESPEELAAFISNVIFSIYTGVTSADNDFL